MKTAESLEYLSEPVEPGFNPGEVVAIAKRRKWYFVIAFALVFIVSVLVALLLPPVYRSSATILIEKQEISPELIQTSVASYAEQQIQEVTQRVMTRTNLWRIIEKFNLYPEDRKKKTRQEVIEKMRGDIDIDFINAELSDPRGGKAVQVMLAFTLSFNYGDPNIAQQVASNLVSLFLEENLKARTETAGQAVKFLEEESRRLKQEMEELQGKLARFKEENLERLPEMSSIYQGELQQIENQLLQIEAQERSLKDRIIYLTGQLAQIDPHAMAFTPEGKRVLDVHDRLKALRSEYPSLLARYSADHPDVVRMKKEIEALEKKETGVLPDVQGMRALLKEKEADLQGLRKRYSDKHPDVMKLQREIDQLRSQIEGAGNDMAATQDAGGGQPDNPAYITLQAQLQSARAELGSLEGTRKALQQRRLQIRENLAASPLVEKEYRMMLEELDATVARYRDLRARQLSAKVSQQFEVERKGERLTLIDPPQVPEKPESPKRPLIILLGFILGCGAGTASAVLAEVVDQSVHDEKALALATGATPLMSIPYLELPEEAERQRRHRWILLGGVVVILLALILFVHFVVSPLDVLWFRVLNKTGMGVGG